MSSRRPCAFGVIAGFAALLAAGLDASAQETRPDDGIAVQLDGILAIADASERTRAINSTARIWAEGDPAAVYPAIRQQVPGDFRNQIEMAFVSSWLFVDTTSALRFFAGLEEPPAYLLSASAMRGAVSGWLPRSPGTDPEEILRIADELPAVIASSVRWQTIRWIAAENLQMAAARVNGFPPEDRRQAGLNIAREFATAFPEAALAWARSLQEPDVEWLVLRSISAADPYGTLARAVSGEEGITLQQVASAAVDSRDLDRAQFGTALAQLPEMAGKSAALSSFVQSWLVNDQDSALDWIASSGVALPAEAIHRAADRAGRDPEAAARMAERMTGANRSEWIGRIGSNFARTDPELALDWLDPFRDDAAYPDALAAIVPELARVDGPRAAGLLASIDQAARGGLNLTVARHWARSDPTAAARWADALPDEVRALSLRAAVDEWQSYDAGAAEAWILGLPAGPLREDALISLVTTAASDGQMPSERLLASFGTESARQSAIYGAISQLIRHDKDVARELYDTRLTDPALRCHAKNLLDPPAPAPGQTVRLFGPVPRSNCSN